MMKRYSRGAIKVVKIPEAPQPTEPVKKKAADKQEEQATKKSK